MPVSCRMSSPDSAADLLPDSRDRASQQSGRCGGRRAKRKEVCAFPLLESMREEQIKIREDSSGLEACGVTFAVIKLL